MVNLKRTVATILRMRVSALRLIDIKKGCVEVTFLVPVFMPGVLKTLTSEQVKQLQDLYIQWMKCGGHEIDFRCGVATSLGEKPSEEEMVNSTCSEFYLCRSIEYIHLRLVV